MTRTRIAAAAAALVALLALPSGARAAPPPVKLGALLAVTGPASFLGAPEARTLELLVAEQNAKGGIDGRPIQLLLEDTGGSPEKALALARKLIDEDQVDAIIGPATTGETMQVKAAAEESGTLLLSCAAAEVIVKPVARWVFKVAPNDGFAADMIFARMKKMGISRIGLLSSNTGFGMAGKQQVEKLAPGAGIQIAVAEVYDKNATDLTAEVTKMKAANVQAILNWSIEPAQSIVLKNVRQLGLQIPVFQSHGFANVQYARAAGAAAEGVMFPASRIVVADALPASNPQKPVVTAYKTAYEGKYKEDVSTFGGHAWDAFHLFVKAFHEGGGDREKVRAALEHTRGFVGTAGRFDFSPTDHNGLGMDAFEMIVVRNGKFAVLGR